MTEGRFKSLIGAPEGDRVLLPEPDVPLSLSPNERRILGCLRVRGPSAKSRIAEITGLSAQSASVIMRRLENAGLIERCPPVRGKVGQPQIPMKLAAEGALFLGLKIGRRSADLILVDFLGKMLDKVSLPYRYPDPDATLRFLRDAVTQITARLSVARQKRIAGLGISIPGFLWEWAKSIGEPAAKMAAWRDRDLRSEVSAVFDIPVYLRNDASCACGAELVFGEPDGTVDFLYLFVGHFIGGGMVIDNRIVTGPTGNAAAFGPLPVPMGDGLRALHDISSLHVLESAIVADGLDPALLWASHEAWDLPAPILDRWLADAAHGIAHAIATSSAVIDFERIVIDGWMPKAVRARLIDETRSRMERFDWTGLVRPTLRAGQIGANARSLGAASLPLSELFLMPTQPD